MKRIAATIAVLIVGAVVIMTFGRLGTTKYVQIEDRIRGHLGG